MVSEQPKKILVIEDDEDIRTVVATRLKRAGYDTTVAADGKDGLRHFYGDRPDLVLLDIAMPVMGGGKTGWQEAGLPDIPGPRRNTYEPSPTRSGSSRPLP